MTYKEILDMISNAAYNRFPKGSNYEGLQNCIVENTTKIYIEQMRLEKEKLQQEYDGLNKKCNVSSFVAKTNGTNLANYQKGEK